MAQGLLEPHPSFKFWFKKFHAIPQMALPKCLFYLLCCLLFLPHCPHLPCGSVVAGDLHAGPWEQLLRLGASGHLGTCGHRPPGFSSVHVSARMRNCPIPFVLCRPQEAWAHTPSFLQALWCIAVFTPSCLLWPPPRASGAGSL
ncbi:hypothetical protein H8957_015625, partial [Semnopithecus entellus]